MQTTISYAANFAGQKFQPQTEALTTEDAPAALAFLAARPINTVIMAGWIKDHGIQSPAHRGTFYGYWNALGLLEGVALIGRATMFETRSDAALLAFAELAQRQPAVQLIIGEAGELEKFWRGYAPAGQTPRRRCHELLYECTASVRAAQLLSGLRPATFAELDQVVAAHAEMVAAETGTNPLAQDGVGFRSRCAGRVAQGRVWTWQQGGELIFKADVVTKTPEAVYLEGLWVNPRHRHRGYGQICWAALSRALLAEQPSICGFVNAENRPAQAFYEKAGWRLHSRYDKIYL